MHIRSILFFIILSLNLHGQYGEYEVDYHGKIIANMENVKSMKVEYFKIEYHEDTVSIVPEAQYKHGHNFHIFFDREGKVTRKEYFRHPCTSKENCLKSYETYEYENGKLMVMKKFTLAEFLGEGSVNPEISTYQYPTDSITFVDKNYNYSNSLIEIIKSDNKIVWQHRKLPEFERRVTHLDDYKRIVKYEVFRSNILRTRYQYLYSNNQVKKPDVLLSEHDPDENKIYRHEYTYNAENDIASIQHVSPQEVPYIKISFEGKYDDHGNWIERKEYYNTEMPNGIVYRTFEYYSEK